MFNLARTKAHFKAELHAVKRFFRREKNIAPVTKDEKPKKEFSKRALARLKAKQIAEDFKKLRRKHYVGGQCSRVKRIPGRTDLSASATHHILRVNGKEETRKQLRHKKAA